MIEFKTTDESILIAKGKYSVVRSALEEQKKLLQAYCGEMMNHTAKILRDFQEQDGSKSIELAMGICRICLKDIEATAKEIEELTKQKNELKPIAWPK